MLPMEAKLELMAYLEEHLEITSDHAAEIVAKHGVKGDPDALQKGYRKSEVNRFFGGVEDEEGHRAIRSAVDMYGVQKYVYVPLCNDKWILKKIRRAITRQAKSVEESGKTVDTQLETIAGKLNCLSRRIMK